MNKIYNPIQLISKAEIVKPHTDKFKAIASNIKAKYGFDLKPQIDLMYVRSCLVTSGINDNDDIFLADEMWAARHSPVMKPSNWQHKDKDIVGVVYSVEARNLNGEIIDFNQETPPNEPYELWTEAAIFKLIHSDRAEEIEKRAAKGNLYVSMEAWFDDYSYGFINENKDISKVIARTADTSFLDTHLRANGGSGKYDNQRFGRALKGFTFGGYGFVDVPANKRSVIDSVLDLSKPDLNSSGATNEEENQEDNIQKLLKSLFSEAQEKEDMEKVTANDNANADLEKVANVVVDKLEAKREAKKAAKKAIKEREEMHTKASNAEAALKSAEEKTNAADASVKTAEAKTAGLVAVFGKVDAALNALIKEVAGATDDTPPEISAIDAAIAKDSGDAVFQAKIAWITKSIGSLKAKADKATELEAEMLEVGATLRETEIRQLFDGILEAKEIDVLVKAGLSKIDAAYEEWLAEKKFLASRLQSAEGAKKKSPPKKNGKLPSAPGPEKDDSNADDDEDDAAKASKDLQTSFSELINGVQEGEESDLKSGVTPGKVSTIKTKVGGSKEAVKEILDAATPENDIDLTAAKGGNGDETEDSPFKTLAAELCGVNSDNKNRPNKAKAAFDPIEQ